MMSLEEAIKHCKEKAEELERRAEEVAMNDAEGVYQPQVGRCRECASEHRQLAEWLRELKAYREFTDWLAHAVLEEDWEESADFYAEVICRKLTKLGKLKVVDNKYMEVNADEDSD
jgi:hypothetical protein